MAASGAGSLRAGAHDTAIALLLLGLLLLGLQAVTGTASADALTLRLEPVRLNPEAPDDTRVGPLEFLAGFVLTADDPDFGGLSGLTLADDGRRLIAVGDRGRWLTARLVLAPDGRLRGLEAAALTPIRNPDGKPVSVREATHDAEAVERLPGGGYVVSFERRHRLWRFAAPDAPAEPLAGPAALRDLPTNGGIEAVAALADGRLLLIAEAASEADGSHAAWLGRPGDWSTLAYAGGGGFKPTDMATLPGGDVLVLERRYSLLGGAGARLRRLPAAALRPGARLDAEEIARLAWPRLVDNFEGLAVAPAPGGGSLVYLLSDDNFNALQDTLLLQFRLPPAAPR